MAKQKLLKKEEETDKYVDLTSIAQKTQNRFGLSITYDILDLPNNCSLARIESTIPHSTRKITYPTFIYTEHNSRQIHQAITKTKQYHYIISESDTYYIHVYEGVANISITIKENLHVKLVYQTSCATIDALHIFVEKNSNVVVNTLTAGHELTGAGIRIGIIKNNASLHWRELAYGAKQLRHEIVNHLSEEQAQGTIKLVYLAQKSSQFNIGTFSIHHAKSTYSDIHTRGVLYDKAKALSRGLVKIEKDAFGSNGYEKQDALLLSNEASADSIPNLQIHNHDVKCTHGSTIGRIDEEQVIYLSSRGLTRAQAQSLIVQGYLAQIANQFDQSIQQKLIESIQHDE